MSLDLSILDSHQAEQKRLTGAIYQTRKPLSRISTRKGNNPPRVQNTIEKHSTPEAPVSSGLSHTKWDR
jgi:hypothetical protein